MDLKTTFDSKHEAIYVYLQGERDTVDRTVVMDDAILQELQLPIWHLAFDLDEKGNLIGVEIIGTTITNKIK